MVIVLASLGHKKGRVRVLWMVGAHACRGRGKRGSRMVAIFSSSLHRNLGFLSSFSGSMRAVVPDALGGISEERGAV
jgi:hypothetical protein